MTKVLRILLRLYPRDFRLRRGDDLIEFVREDATREERGFTRRIRFWSGMTFDMVRGAGRAWRDELRPATERAERRSRWSLTASDRFSDVRQSARSLAKTPLVTAVIVATLAVGVGLNTAIFSVVHAVLIEPFPYDEPDRLYYLGSRWTNDGVSRARHTGADFDTFRNHASAFDDVAAAAAIRQNLTGTETPLQVQVGWASTNLFSLLGVETVLGTGFTEDSPPGTLVLSFALWQNRFGSDPSVLGRTLRLDDHPYTVAGVLPRGFELYLPGFPTGIDVWKTPDDWWQNGDLWSAAGVEFALLNLIGRLGEGATPVQAQRELDAFARSFREDRIDYERAGVEYEVLRLDETTVGELRPTLYILFAAVALVLVIACANVMNLMLVRSFARSKEISLRLALGGSRWRIVRLLLTESLVLALLSGLAGILVATVATGALLRLAPAGLARLDQVSLDPIVLGFGLCVAFSSVIAFGLVPSIGAARGSLPNVMYSSRMTASARPRRLSGALVVAQISLSLVLLISAGLLTRSLVQLTRVEPGFDGSGLLTFAVSLPGTQYERPHETNRFFRQLEERIEGLAGVESAGVVWPLPLSGRNWSNTYAGGRIEEGERAYAEYRLATPDYFETMDIPLRDGRPFSPADARHVAIVSAVLAERAWPGESPVGRAILANPWGGGVEAFEVIGVAGDVRYRDLREPPRDTIYFDSHGWSWTDWEVDFVVRTDGAPSTLVQPIREQIVAMDPTIPMARIRSMSDYVDDHLSVNRFALSLIGLFAVASGVLAGVGLYGVLSYSVSQRRQEIGVRMALGARRSGIIKWMMGQGITLVLVGIAIGILVATLVTRMLQAYLFEVAPTDLATFGGIATVSVLLGIVATLVPARRAARVDPVTSLRLE